MMNGFDFVCERKSKVSSTKVISKTWNFPFIREIEKFSLSKSFFPLPEVFRIWALKNKTIKQNQESKSNSRFTDIQEIIFNTVMWSLRKLRLIRLGRARCWCWKCYILKIGYGQSKKYFKQNKSLNVENKSRSWFKTMFIQLQEHLRKICFNFPFCLFKL